MSIPVPNIAALDRLKSQLLTSGLSEKNNDLFQVINQLIDFLRQSINLTASQIIAITPGPTPTPSKLIVIGSPPESCCDDSETGGLGLPLGGALPYFKLGSVIFSDGARLSEDNTNLFWSIVLQALGIGGAPVAGDRLLVNGNIRLSGATPQISFPSSNGTKLDFAGGSSIIVQEASWGLQLGAGVGQGAATGFVRIVTGDGEVLRVGGGAKATLIGLLDISNAISGQIKFPATQNPSADANTLDDYEELTWTPVDTSGAGLAFSSVTGLYIKIGKAVFISGVLQYPVTADGSNTQIGGLPFTNANIFNQMLVDSPGLGTDVFLFVNNSTTDLQLYNNAGVRYTNNQLSGKAVIFSGTYFQA